MTDHRDERSAHADALFQQPQAFTMHNHSTEHTNFLHSEMLATLSHELRSPLASIKGYVTTLLRHDQQISVSERRTFLEAINEGSNRLEQVINRLMELAQLEAGTVSLQLTAVDLGQLVEEVMTMAARRYTERIDVPAEQRFSFEQWDCAKQQASEPVIIQADRHRLRMMLENLIDNALKYSAPDSRIEIILTRRCIDEQHLAAAGEAPLQVEMVELCVRDHGIGIAPDQIEHIFERFQRVDMQLTRQDEGLGLGLAICKRIVDLHRGSLWAESQPGRGSTFHVLLPQTEHLIVEDGAHDSEENDYSHRR